MDFPNREMKKKKGKAKRTASVHIRDVFRFSVVSDRIKVYVQCSGSLTPPNAVTWSTHPTADIRLRERERERERGGEPSNSMKSGNVRTH
jgi:hypothetical protein